MFQLFVRARVDNYFKSRSSNRDMETDATRIASIFHAIETALQEAKAEHAGLAARINDVLARSAVTLGNDSDEYLTRDPDDRRRQNALGAEIANGQRRLKELDTTIGHFQFLKTVLVSRFPDSRLQVQH